MSLFSIFSKKQPEATSVAEALAGATSTPSTKSKKRNAEAQNEQLIPEKKRARRRLIGAIAMVLAVVIGLPMMLDTEPQHLNKNIVIQIPSKDTEAIPLNSKEDVKKTVSDESADQLPKTVPNSALSLATTSSNPIINSPSPASPLIKSENKSENKNELVPTELPAKNKVKAAESSSTNQHASNADESARAIAILNGTTSTSTEVAPAKTPTRIVVQVGAFATQEKVNELRNKLTAAGIKSYTQIVKTSSGEKIRVRIGPFSDKESANKTKLQLEKLGLSSSLISL